MLNNCKQPKTELKNFAACMWTNRLPHVALL